MRSLLSYDEKYFFSPCLGNRIMLSSKDHLGENILLGGKTDFSLTSLGRSTVACK